MQKKSKLIPYSLKLDEEIWNQINKNRMSLVGVLNPQGISKKDYIQDAIIAYNQYFEEKVLPRVNLVHLEIQSPLPFFSDNGLDVRW
jgi:hypothetical protein